MKDTKTILAMLAKAREDILEEKSSKNKTGDAFVIYMKKKGYYCANEVFAYNWRGNRDNIEALFDATQMQGWYITRVSKRCRWSNYTDMTIYLEQSSDGFTTNVDIDVIDALKEMTTMMTNFTPDPAKIEAKKAMKQEAYPWNLASFLSRSDSGNHEWFVYTDDKCDFYTSGHSGATGAIKYLTEKATTHRLCAWKGKYSGFTKIWLTKINYNTPTNLTPEVLKRLTTLADTKGIA